MRALIKRNLLLYFRDRSAVFFSLLGIIIVVALYVLFLAQLQVDAIKSAVPVPLSDDDISWLINSWIAAGIVSIIPITSCLGSLGTMVNDKEKRIINDFRSSPMEQFKYPLAAVIAGGIVGCATSVLALVLYSVYLYLDCGHIFSLSQYAQAFCLIVETSVFACSFMGFIASFFRTNSSFMALNTMVGAMIGFVNGVYVPLGVLPSAVQVVIQILPFGHSAVVFRQILMSDALDKVFAGLPPMAVETYSNMYGVVYEVGGNQLSPWWSVGYLALVAVLAFSLFVLSHSRLNKVR